MQTQTTKSKTNECKRRTKRTQINFTDPSLTKQEFKDDTDINIIIKRASLTGELPTNKKQSIYGDCTQIPDYRSALHTVIEAENAFDSLDSKIRARFNNDPGQMISFIEDPRNRQEGVALGLFDPPPPEKLLQEKTGTTKSDMVVVPEKTT